MQEIIKVGYDYKITDSENYMRVFVRADYLLEYLNSLENKVVILGGDLYLLQDIKLTPTYNNWFYEIQKSDLDYQNSIEKIIQYFDLLIKNKLDLSSYFVDIVKEN